MSKLKPIYVTLKEGRHKTQPWSFVIDRPGPQKGETKRERYVSMWSAKRGAAYKLSKGTVTTCKGLLKEGSLLEVTSKGGARLRPVKFIVQRLKRK
jgi:hypothetical protein